MASQSLLISITEQEELNILVKSCQHIAAVILYKATNKSVNVEESHCYTPFILRTQDGHRIFSTDQSRIRPVIDPLFQRTHCLWHMCNDMNSSLSTRERTMFNLACYPG